MNPYLYFSKLKRSEVRAEVDGDEASGRSIFHFYTGTDGAPVLAIIGVYHDRFRRTAEGWRLAHRVIHRANDPDTNTPE